MAQKFIEASFLAQVRNISMEGYGVIDHPDGSTFFSLGVFPGDEGVFEVVQRKKSYGHARLIELTKPSHHRRPPPCPHHGFKPQQCGGCPWMSIPYPLQLQYKQQMLLHSLSRNGLIAEHTTVNNIWGAPAEFYYRNRAQLKTNGDVVGFMSRFSTEIAPIKDCIVLNDHLRWLLKEVSSSLPQTEWRPIPPHTYRFFEIDDDMQSTSQIVVNKRRPFKQANNPQNARMKAWLQEQLTDWDAASPTLELFSGSGNFTRVLSEAGFKHILASEISEQAVQNLNSLQLTGVQAIACDMNRPSHWKMIKDKMPRPRYLVLDPSREGFNKLQLFLKNFPSIEQIIYISCSLETYNQDVSRIKKMGFLIKTLQPIDQLPQTPHIEILSVIEKVK